MRGYEELPGLESLYLEDSWVLGIQEHPERLRFDLDAVLTKQHPLYSPPKPDEQYCYLRLALEFPNPRDVNWIDRSNRQFHDAAGETDYGSIDSFLWEGNRYDRSGYWGHVVIEGDFPLVILP